MGSNDIQVPESVLCAQFGRLQFHLDFRAPQKVFKKRKLSTTDAEIQEAMLLDDVAPPEYHIGHSEALENAASNLSRSLTSSVTACFTNPKTTTSDQDLLLLGKFDSDNDIDDDMLLSQMNEAPSMTYASSLSYISSSLPPTVPSKRPKSGSTTSSSEGLFSVLEVDVACKLSEIALRIMIGGYGRGTRGMLGVQVKKPSPSTSLCEIIPSLWSPGFKDVSYHCVSSPIVGGH